MRVSRTLALVLLAAFLVSSPVVASANQQKIYSLDSDLYSALEVLYISQGLSLPSTTGPYSQSEFALMLEKIDRSRLDGGLLTTYDYVSGQLGLQPKIQGNGIGMSWNFDTTVETYTHTDTTNFVGRQEWNRSWNDQKPLLSIGLETWPGDNFYGYSEFTVGNTYTLENGFGSTAFSTNIPVVPPAVLMDLDFNMPYRAFVAAGGDHWTFQLGRDRLSWGAGTTGNLMLSDNLKYHNMARITTFSDRFKYTFVTSFFPHPSAYYEDGDSSPLTGDGQDELLNGLYLFMAHRLEWRMFEDKVGLTLTESIMYQSSENLLDLRILNPAMIFHDYYIRSNANSLLGLELDYTPIKGLNLYGQMVVDEFSLPGEPVPSATVSNFPVTFGYLAGVKGVLPLKHLVGYGSLEGAYTDPYLYLRYTTNSSPTSSVHDSYGLNYVGVIREFTNKMGTHYNPSFLGYPYGNDAVVVNLNAGLRSYGNWNVSGNVFYMAHGTFDMFTIYSEVGDTKAPIVTTPTDDGSSSIGNYNDATYATRDAVSHTLVAGVHGSYQLSSMLSLFGQVDFITIANYQNHSSRTAGDVQLTFGLTCSI
ncbi:hypothetical protein [Sphaerochaeta sp.]|uniref:hypothetical protein n=1 Tax=Sphaerochaeta sp. TaxID=1972642 RepID=UPI002FCB4036